MPVNIFINVLAAEKHWLPARVIVVYFVRMRTRSAHLNKWRREVAEESVDFLFKVKEWMRLFCTAVDHPLDTIFIGEGAEVVSPKHVSHRHFDFAAR